MTSQYILSLMLLLSHNLYQSYSLAVHQHGVDNEERESDGSYRTRDADHYGDGGHNVEFDHEAILGSVKEAEEFDRLSAEEAKEKLALLLLRMDTNGDEHISRDELQEWILKSFSNLSKEEAQERMADVDENKDGLVTWREYLQDAFGTDVEEDIDTEDTGDTGLLGTNRKLVKEEKAMWNIADKNNDGILDETEFETFSNPEEHEEMHPFLVNQTLREKDVDDDGRISFQEYIGERGIHQDREWLVSERERFDSELDTNKDGFLDYEEVKAWIVPNNNEIAEDEVNHLFASADDDHDERLSFVEVLTHHDVFVGSEATDFSNDLGDVGDHGHFDDEL